MQKREKRGADIDSKIAGILRNEQHPISTRGLALKAKLSWHTIITHCLRMQLIKKINGYKIGNLNVWVKK